MACFFVVVLNRTHLLLNVHIVQLINHNCYTKPLLCYFYQFCDILSSRHDSENTLTPNKCGNHQDDSDEEATESVVEAQSSTKLEEQDPNPQVKAEATDISLFTIEQPATESVGAPRHATATYECNYQPYKPPRKKRTSSKKCKKIRKDNSVKSSDISSQL